MQSRPPEIAALFGEACNGDRSALARLLSLIERGGDDARTVGRLVYPKTGNGYVVGITGDDSRGYLDALIEAVQLWHEVELYKTTWRRKRDNEALAILLLEM